MGARDCPLSLIETDAAMLPLMSESIPKPMTMITGSMYTNWAPYIRRPSMQHFRPVAVLPIGHGGVFFFFDDLPHDLCAVSCQDQHGDDGNDEASQHDQAGEQELFACFCISNGEEKGVL